MTTRNITFEYKQNQVLTDVATCIFQDPNNTFGIKELQTGTIVRAPGTILQRIAIGKYIYPIDDLDKAKQYIYYIKVITLNGQIEYILGMVDKLIVQPISDKPVVPEGMSGTPVDINLDGYYEGYKYDLYGYENGIKDGYQESFDLNNDKIIDMIDIGTVDWATPGQQFNSQGERIDIRTGLGGTLGAGQGLILRPELDGKPDVPSPKGSPAQTGPFANSQGFDGIDGSIPATGGGRTNRDGSDGKSPGMWEGISFGEIWQVPIGPRGMFIKDKAHAMTRAMLKDTESACFAFTEDEVDLYLEMSLCSFNAYPTFTAFTWDFLQERWLSPIVKGAVVWALYAQSLIEAGREFTISENGLAYTPPNVSDKMQSYASTLIQHYTEELKTIKNSFVPMPCAVGLYSNLNSNYPQLRRLRHLREKKII